MRATRQHQQQALGGNHNQRLPRHLASVGALDHGVYAPQGENTHLIHGVPGLEAYHNLLFTTQIVHSRIHAVLR